MSGLFITVEGIEGVGKSTNMAFIAESLESAGHKVCVTREPGGTPMGERIRQLILETPGDGLSAQGELLLMFAARAEHLNSLIRPALQRGETVLCDRFTDATFAYQGGGRELGPSLIARLQDMVQGEMRPDLTILLDVPLEVSAQRVAGRGEAQDRFEQEQELFFGRVRQAYLDIASAEPERVRVVDASQSLSGVQADIRSIIDEKVFNK
ncbi:MAG: dTMP kinase [Gammaproteobacteria bacterium]